jgi:Zn-dependent protease with chaperone function
MIVLLLAGALVPSRRESPARGYPLARIEHPLIYAYVDKLCDVMGAPRPVRIDLRTDANASASFDGGWFWIVRRRMVLTIGTTLVAGMTRRELTGVIAHEIGHFTQAMGMRSTRLLEAINRWFFRVIHERGMVDDVLEDGRESGWLLIVTGAAMIAWTLGAIRVLLWTVASGSRLMTMAMLRRMEIAADRCEIRVAGSDAFVRSMARIVELNEGFRKATELTRLEAVQRRLPEDIAGLAVSLAPRLPRDPRGFVAGFREPRSLFSTHPPMERRVAMAAELAEPGIVLSDGPAARLLPGFDAVCRAVTMHSHRKVLGESLDGMRILSTDALLGRGEHDPGRVRAAAPVQPSRIRSDEPRRTPESHGDVIPFAD